jgi:hypothetical protein
MALLVEQHLALVPADTFAPARVHPGNGKRISYRRGIKPRVMLMGFEESNSQTADFTIMSKNIIIVIGVICFAVCFCTLLSARTAAAAPALASADWSANAPHSLAEKLPTRKEVEEFLGFSDTTDYTTDSLCSFTFADLHRTGSLSLIVASDTSGRGFCNGIGIIDRTVKGFESTDLPPTEIGQGIDVSKLIKDIDGDGRLELVVNMTVGGYQGGAHCGLEWPVIYAWTGTSYADVSGQFKGYYRQRLAEVKLQLNESSPTPAPEQVETFESQPPGLRLWAIKPERALSVPGPAQRLANYHMDCLKAEAAKTERFLGISSDAGMGDAIKWSESEDPLTREFAATIFDDMGTPAALENLKNLTADSDSSVAAVTKNDLRIRTAQRGLTSATELESEPLVGN